MSRRLRYLTTARNDLVEIAIYLTDQSGDKALAAAFVDRLRDKCRKLASLPGTLGTARPELGADIRSTPCQGYVIFFRYEARSVEIITVLHGSRDVDPHFG